MGLLYEPREKDERVFLHTLLARQGNSDASVVICDAEGKPLCAHAVKFDKDGLRRFLNPEVAKLDCAHDASGCIALHPDDPAMKRIAELEARVRDLEAENVRLREAFDVASEDAARKKPTVAPELTDEQIQALWSAYRKCLNSGGNSNDAARAMIVAAEAMRRPVDNAEIERLAQVAYHEYSRLFARPLKWDEDTYEADRELWWRVARAIVEAMR